MEEIYKDFLCVCVCVCVVWVCVVRKLQARSQTMSTVGAANSSAGAYIYIHTLYVRIPCFIIHTHCVCVFFMHNRKKRGCQDRKFNTLVTQCAIRVTTTQHVAYTNIFFKSCFQQIGSKEATRG
jgi:hypothetical protein